MATSSAATRLAGPSGQPPPASYATFSPTDPLVDPSDQPPHPQSQASWVSRLLLTWVSPLMALGNTRHLTEHDIWPLQREHQSDFVAVQFGRDYGATRSLVAAFLRSFGTRFMATGAAYLCVALCSLVGPLVLHEVVASLSSGSYAIVTLLQWIAVLFAAQVVQALAANYASLDSQLMAIQFTGAIKHLLYAKAMTLSADARRQKSVGDITTLYTMDCAHLIRTVNVAHQLWILPLQIVAVSAVLYWLVGVASLAGLATVLGVLYVNHSLSSVVQKLQGQFMRLKDARMKRVAETFRAISLVKFNAWESRMANRIATARDAEVASIRQYFRLDIARTVLTAGMPIFISVVTFAVYAGLLGHALTPALVFTSLSLFRLIQQPLRQIAGIYSTLIRVRVSADRIADFFALPELAPRSSSSYSGEDDLVVIDDGAFGWDHSGDVAAAPLQRVSLRLRHDDLVVVHGPVGCGKSSLCAAILGEMTTLRGRVSVNASVAYCSQQPWIQNMTLRDNVLFGARWNAQRYAAVLDSCALTHDLVSLPAGDLTEIGERGVNLSGGQKARVALARACYADADVYLLDAPLAAVDAIVANEIFQKCVLRLLRHKAVLLVTHNPEIMASPFVTMAVTVSPDGELQETVARRGTPPPVATIEPLPPKALDAEQRVETATGTSTKAKGEQHNLVQKENREQGRVGASVFSAYYAAIGGCWIVLLVLATQAIQQVLQVGGSFWLGHWSSSSVSTTTGLTVYTLLGGLAALLVFVQTLTVYLVGLRAAQSLFNRMTRALLHAPLGFFDATPIGRLLGRYAEDVSIVDFTLPTLFSGFIASLFTVASSLLTAAVVIQWRGLLLLPLVVVYARVGAFYIEPAREIERFHKTTWSPILSHLAASLEGATTVRAFGATSVQRFRDLNDQKLDTRNMAWYANLAFSQWFVLRVQLLGCVAVLVVASSLVLLHDVLAPAIVGLAFSYALGISQNMEQIVQLWSSIETRMVSPERLHEYISIDQERAFDLPAKDLTLPSGWPLAGAIAFQHVSFRYASTASPLVLRDVSLTIKACEKVGIVGRTGAGKSSLSMALFRINELAAGTIMIDGVDTSTVGLKTLREKLSIIPQNPVLFQGPLRAYLDPFDEYADEDLWHAIRRVGLSGRIGRDDQKLACPVDENGENFSVGERQMLCMARALLRHSRIVVFDEATAAMDRETDQKLQRVVREAFADSTVLTIAHRLDTVLDADRIVVMERGEVVEFASPRELVEKGTGHFFELMDEGGYLEKFRQGLKEEKTKA